jgi:hypothetical protein
VKYWYRIDIVEGDDSRVLVGTSEYDPQQLVEHLETRKFLVLTDLSYRDNQNKIVSWSAWDPRLASVAYINPKFVTTVMPFMGDPRQSNSVAP